MSAVNRGHTHTWLHPIAQTGKAGVSLQILLPWVPQWTVTQGIFSLSGCAVISTRDHELGSVVWTHLPLLTHSKSACSVLSPNSSYSQAACLRVQIQKHTFMSWWDLAQLEGKPEVVQKCSTSSATPTPQCGLKGHQRLPRILIRYFSGPSRDVEWPMASRQIGQPPSQKPSVTTWYKCSEFKPAQSVRRILVGNSWTKAKPYFPTAFLAHWAALGQLKTVNHRD